VVTYPAIDPPATLTDAIVPYAETSRSGVVRIRKDLDEPIEGKDVLVVEGICASGLSLAYLLRNFETRQPASIRICAFLVKQARPVEVARLRRARDPRRLRGGVPSLDVAQQYRNLPYVARLP
jgi:hypoxanthine phosphoribosyltransferase